MSSINYVIASWSGNRLVHSMFNYVGWHIELLSTVQHSIDQITIVAPYNLNEPTEFTDCINKIQAVNSRVVILRKRNWGLSYGSYDYAWQTYGKQFDYYIFIEDDYCFTHDNFDNILIHLFNNKTNCGYLSSLVLGIGENQHAAISNGITSSKVLDEIQAFNLVQTDQMYELQIQFSQNFIQHNYQLYDYTEQFASPFYNHLGKIIVYGKLQKPCLCVPYQYWIKHNDSII